MPDSLPLAVVVVGGAGCLGRSVVRRWIAKLRSACACDCECANMNERPKVVSVDKRPNPMAEVNILVDLMDTDAVEQQLFGRFTVQAMIVAVKPPLVGPAYQNFMELNVAAVCELMQLAERHKVGQFVYAGSIACANHWVPHINSKENDSEANPSLTELQSPYDLSKAVAERFILKHHSENGTRTVSLRLGGLYGIDDDEYWHRRLPLRLSCDVTIDLAAPQIASNYVENAAEAMLRAVDGLASDASVGGRFYFYTHGDCFVSQQEISKRIAQQSGRLHLILPWSLFWVVVNTWHKLSVLPQVLLPSNPFQQPAGRATTPKPYFTSGSCMSMGSINQTFDNALFQSTFGYSHIHTLEEALEEIHKAEVQGKPAASGSSCWQGLFCMNSLAFGSLRSKTAKVHDFA